MIYRDRFHECIACGTVLRDAYAAGHRFEQCPTCRGQWVEENQLACMYNDLAPLSRPEFLPTEIREPDPAGGAPEPMRRCLECDKVMRRVLLLETTVHRCEDHGVWFDAHELEDVLRAVTLSASR